MIVVGTKYYTNCRDRMEDDRRFVRISVYALVDSGAFIVLTITTTYNIES